MADANEIKRELIDEVEARWGLVCPLCRAQYVTSLHHIIPRARTSHKHEAWWLWDERNLLLICYVCDNAMLHTRPGIIRCLRIQADRHPEWDLSIDPWREYVEVENDEKEER